MSASPASGHQRWLPTHLQTERDPWQYHRAVALLVLYATVGGLSLLWGILMLFLQLLWDISLVVELGVVAIVFSLIAVQAAGFYRFGNLKIFANIFSYSYFLVILALVMLSGGYSSPLVLFLFCCTVITFRISSREDGIMNALFVLLAGLAIMAMGMLDIETPNLLHGFSRPILWMSVWMVTLAIFAACLATYHHPQREAGENSR